MSSAERDHAATPAVPQTDEPARPDAPRTRRQLLRSGGAAAIAGLLGAFGLATATSAKNGDAVRAGQRTSASKSTSLESRRGTTMAVRNSGGKDAVAVLGEATSNKGESTGIQGVAASPDGAAGRFVATGGGTAVDARANQKDGVALRTRGRLELTERSGTTQVSGGAEFVIPVAGGLSRDSLVLATLQDHHAGVHVEAASVLDVEKGVIVVRLNQALPEPARVGWIVLD